MNGFNTLDDYYQFVEGDTSLLYDINLAKKLLALRDKLSDETLKSNCTYELHFVEFPFHKGKLSPQISFTNGEEYPNLSLFQAGVYYLKARAAGTVNSKFRGKYNHLLWELLKHNDFGRLAVDSYYALLEHVYTHDITIAADTLTQQAFNNHFETLYTISQRLNHRANDVMALFDKYLKSDKLSGFRKASMMTFISTEAKKINAPVLQNFFDYSKEIVESGEHPLLVEKHLDLLILLSHKLKVSATPSYEKLAEHFLAEGNKRQDFISHDFYLKAISNFQKAGNKAKVEDVSGLVEKAKRTLNFKKVTSEHSSEMLNHLWRDMIARIDKILALNDSEAIYDYLIHGPGFLPTAKSLEENIQSEISKIMRVMTFDINKNIDQKGVGGINVYLVYIQNFTLKLTWYMFSNGIKAGTFTFDSLIGYLKRRSWYGRDFTFIDGDGERQGFDWIQLISPSLLSFFKQSELDMAQGKNSDEGYILAVDSLSLKFEGLLREFCRTIGAQTIEFKADGTQERISFDKLLSNEKVEAIIPPDDIAFLKWLFTDEGFNLRNNVAHCFYPARKYSAGIMFLLIMALLRLGNYEFNVKGESTTKDQAS
jgi:hypothetical protein